MFVGADHNRDTLVLLYDLYRDDHYVFRGYDEGKEKSVIGYYNVSKINPEEPDLRIYYAGQDRRGQEALAMWCKVSRTGRKYLIGNSNGICYIGLINFNRLSDSDPYMQIYYVMKEIRRN